MKKILICVPTCDRPEMVCEVLKYELDYYVEYGLELMYYDSSAGADTGRIIEQISEDYPGVIQYCRSSTELCLDYKLLELLQTVDRNAYDYIWLISDSISITRDALKIILPLLEEGYDLLRLPLAGAGSREDIICTTAVEWFGKCSQGMAHMASTIMSTSLLKCEPTDWQALGQRYIVTNELNEQHGYFFMIAFYLEQILKLDHFRGLMIGNRMKWRRDSPLKGRQSYWNKMLFDVWIRSYCETIRKLPDVYLNKERVIRQSDNCMVGRFSGSMLARYRVEGLYTRKVYKRYRADMPLVTDTPMWCCAILAGAPKGFLKKFVLKKCSREDEWEESLNRIHENIADKSVIIYGAGLYGERAAEVIKADWNNRLIGIAVTDKQNNMDEVNGIKVYSIDELIQYKDTAAVIIATLPNAAKQIRRELRRRGFRNYTALLGY